MSKSIEIKKNHIWGNFLAVKKVHVGNEIYTVYFLLLFEKLKKSTIEK